MIHVTHYLPYGTTGTAWCGRMVGFHPGIPATAHPERVTCRTCRRSMVKWDREHQSPKLVGKGA